MTTVAWRDGIMAADTQGQRDGMRINAKKIHRVQDASLVEALIGISGNLPDCLKFVGWFGKRDKELDFKMFRQDSSDAPDVAAIVVRNSGVEYWTEHCQPIPILDEFAAIGSGAHAALAAMHMGATALEAVRIASLVDPHTNSVIQVERWGAAP